VTTFDLALLIDFHTCRGELCHLAQNCLRHAGYQYSEFRFRTGFWRERLITGKCNFFAPMPNAAPELQMELSV